jgi:hypothetical protein
VFLDETWIRTDMTRLRGWCQRGVPLLAKVPHGRWRTLTFIAGLRRTEIVAPCVFDGPINGDLFTAWVEQSLVPTLKQRDVVVLDNLGSHKSQRARQAVRATDAHLLFLPAYSPDLNPIKMVFANSPPASPTGYACRSLKPASLKTLFRKADRRTIEDAWREVGSLLDRFSPTECAAYLRHAGSGAVAA